MSSRLLALIPLAVAINVAIGRIVAELSLPIYLDAVGTILVSALAGLGAGIATGLISQVFAAFVSGYVWLAFAPVQVLIALVAYAAARQGGFQSVGRSLAWGCLLGVIGGVLSAFISYLAFKGVTAGGVTFLTTVLVGAGMDLPWAVALSSLATDVIDKALAFGLVGVALHSLPVRMISRYPLALRALGR